MYDDNRDEFDYIGPYLSPGPQFVEDNRYQKNTAREDWCDTCDEDTVQWDTEGHDGYDSYSYVLCAVCGKDPQQD